MGAFRNGLLFWDAAAEAPLAGCSSWQLEEQPEKDLVVRLMKELRFPIRAALFYGCIFFCFPAVRKMSLDIPYSNAILGLGYPAF